MTAPTDPVNRLAVMRYPGLAGRAVPGTRDTPPDTWSPSDDAYRGHEDEQDYDILRDTVIAAFNPPDDDIAEIALMTSVVDDAYRFVVAQPCSCSAIYDEDVDICWRCDVLGRVADRPVER